MSAWYRIRTTPFSTLALGIVDVVGFGVAAFFWWLRFSQ